MNSENKTSHHFFISSRDNTMGDSTNNFEIDNPLIKDATSFRVLSVTIPHTYFNINSHNNTLTIFKTGDASDRTINITPGDYTESELTGALKTALDATAGTPQTYTVSVNINTYKYTITQNSSTFIIRGSSTLNEVIGFANSDTTASITHTATNIYDLRYTNHIRIKSNALTAFDTKVNASDKQGSIFLEFSVYNSHFGESIYHKFNHLHYNYEPKYTINYDFELYDDKNRLLGGDTGLNGKHTTMHLLFHTRKSNNHTHNSRYDPRSFQNTGYGDIIN